MSNTNSREVFEEGFNKTQTSQSNNANFKVMKKDSSKGKLSKGTKKKPTIKASASKQ